MAAAFSLAADIFGLPAAAALIASLVLAWLGLRAANSHYGWHVILPWAVGLGFVAGYAALPRDFAPWQPDATRSWTFLPYAALVAALLAAAIPPARAWQPWRYSVVAVAPLAAIYLLPSWPSWGLETKSLRWLLLVYLFVVGVPLQALMQRMSRLVLLGTLAGVTIVLAVAIFAEVSLSYAQLAAIAGAALLGAWIAAAVSARPADWTCQCVIPVYTGLAGSIAWMACVDPDPPETVLLAIPLIPMGLWLAVAGQWLLAQRSM